MKVSNVEIMGIESSMIASGYPMRTELNEEFSEKTEKRCKVLSKAGGAEEQYMTGMIVNFDLTCSNKMWVEAERYRFLYFVSSQSTMHRISKFDIESQCNEYVDPMIIDIVKDKVERYNNWSKYQSTDEWLKNNDWDIETKEQYIAFVKRLYLEVLYNIPSGFELTARLSANYRCLKNIYHQRKTHRLPEWREFCKWIETLPHAELITGEKENRQ